MKAKILSSSILLLAVAAGQQIAPTAQAAVTFSVTPATVSNTYNGVITLQVNGLTNTETVAVQKFIDLNTNGVIDDTDWLVQQFKLTDGQAGMVIGGVTNFNVPGDTDTTAGQITAKLNFRNGDFMQNIAGQYAFKLSSPGGHFAPIVNFLNVTNLPYAQKFTGNVVSNGTSTTLTNAIVLLFGAPSPGNKGPNGSPLAGTVVNNSGGYTIQAPLGTYAPVAFSSNYLANFSTPPILSLGSGQTVTTNLTLSHATASISGQVVDANNPSKGLPAVLLTFEATNGLMGVGFSDTNGGFTLRVQSSPVQWWLRADNTSLTIRGYVGSQDRTNANAGQTGVTLALPKATALFYGSVKDSLGNSLSGLDVYASDNNNHWYETAGYSDANGDYFASILGGLGSNDPWWVQVSSDSGPTNFIFSQPAFLQNGGTNVSAGTAVRADFTAILATNHISGLLKDSNGNPIAGVGIWANATINGLAYNLGSVSTDSSGNYWLNVANGTWSLGVSTCNGCSDGLPGIYLPPTNHSVVIANNNGTANFTALAATNHISGHVQQANSNPIVGVGVGASATINGVGYVQYVDTDTNGDYLLNVANGTWTVGLNPGTGGDSLDNILGSGTYQLPANEPTNILNNNAVINFTVLPQAPLQITTTNLPSGSVGSYYSQSLGGSGGQLPYNWWLPGGTISLPPGQAGDMSFSSDGTISGTPNAPGFYSFWVGVYDSASPANTVTQMVSVTINASVPDVANYYVLKLESFIQVDPTSFVLNTNFGPFNAYLGLVQSAQGSVPIANVTLPGGSAKALPWGSSGLQLQNREAFANQASIEAAYPPGSYTFGLYALHDGLQFPVLSMPSSVYPNPPRVSNFAAAQSLNPSSPFTLQWDSISGATTNDSIWVVVTDPLGNPVFSTPEPALEHSAALRGTATSVLIPTNTFQPAHAYLGWITYFRTTSVNTSEYPGVAGATLVAAQTAFTLTQASAAAPVLSQPTWISNNRFGFLLSGATGQNYTVLVATNVARPLTNWATLLITNLSASPAFIQDNQATNGQRFYRAKVGP